MTNSTPTSSTQSSVLAPSVSRASRTVLALIKGYQFVGSRRVSACRFYPSCSAYAYEAVELHGAARGSLLALRRILKCRPLGPHGIDLVPTTTKEQETPS